MEIDRERETFVFVCTFEFYLNMYVVSFTQMGRVNLCIVRFGSSTPLGSARLGSTASSKPPCGRSPFNPASFVHFSLIYVLLKCHTTRGHLFSNCPQKSWKKEQRVKQQTWQRNADLISQKSEENKSIFSQNQHHELCEF